MNGVWKNRGKKNDVERNEGELLEMEIERNLEEQRLGKSASPIEIDTSNTSPVSSKSKGNYAHKKIEITTASPEKIRASRNSLDADSKVTPNRSFSFSRSSSSRNPSIFIPPGKSPSRNSPTLVPSPPLVKSPSAWALSTPAPTTTTANMKSPPDSRKPSFNIGVKTPPLTSQNASRNPSRNPVKIDKKFETEKKTEIEKKIKEESKLLQEKLIDEEMAEKMRVMDEKMKKMELAERLYEEKEKVI